MGRVRRQVPADTSNFTAYFWEVSGERVRRTLPISRLTFGKCPARGSGGHFPFDGLLLGSVWREALADTSNLTAYIWDVSGERVRRTLTIFAFTFEMCPARGSGGRCQFCSLLLGSVRREGPADASNVTAYFEEVSGEMVPRTLPFSRLT